MHITVDRGVCPYRTSPQNPGPTAHPENGGPRRGRLASASHTDGNVRGHEGRLRVLGLRVLGKDRAVVGPCRVWALRSLG